MCSVHGPGPQSGMRIMCIACLHEVDHGREADARQLRQELAGARKRVIEVEAENRLLRELVPSGRRRGVSPRLTPDIPGARSGDDCLPSGNPAP